MVWHGVSLDVVWYILCCGIGRVVQSIWSLHRSFYTYLHYSFFLKIFEGNTDSDSIVTHSLAPVMVLNSIQIHPKACNIHCALRVEFLGCYKGYFYLFYFI